MTERFQKTLIGNQFFDSTETGEIGFIGKFTELNKVMFTANSGMTATHPNSSKWYTWPFMHRTIFYWQGETTPLSSEKSYIYLLGNPSVYWLGTLSVVAFILISIFKLTNKRSLSGDPKISNITLLIIIGYLANLLPFALIGRVMFLYHYEIALIFSVISIALLLDYLKPKTKMISFL
jgi:dolichyl-phosphate-mannose-protein mannosyltransferase